MSEDFVTEVQPNLDLHKTQGCEITMRVSCHRLLQTTVQSYSTIKESDNSI
jgi:hypothetical protein